MPIFPAKSRATERLLASQLLQIQELSKSNATFSISGLIEKLNGIVNKLREN